MLVDKLKNRSSPGPEVKREQRPAVLCMAQEGKVRVPHPLQSFGLLGLMSELFVNNEERGSEGHLPSNGWKALESCCNCSLGFNFPRVWVIGPPRISHHPWDKPAWCTAKKSDQNSSSGRGCILFKVHLAQLISQRLLMRRPSFGTLRNSPLSAS